MSVLYLILLFFDGLLYQETDEQTDNLLSRCSIQLAYCMDFVVLCFWKIQAPSFKHMSDSYASKVANQVSF